MVECPVEFVDGVGAERVAYFGAVEGDADDAVGARGPYVSVIGDVGEVKTFDLAPLGWVEWLRSGIAHGFVVYGADGSSGHPHREATNV